MKLRTVLCAAVALSLTAAAFAQDKKLSVGDPAPGLDIEKWVKGGETSIQPGNVYVVEFWATWCGPCKKSIPHLTQVQKDYGDQGLTIIGVAADDKDTPTVEKFVSSQGAKMGYTVGVDRSQGTKRAWFNAAGQNGIPCAFIVDRKNKIAYIGNPLEESFDDSLKRVMSGRFDSKLEKQAQPSIAAAESARKSKNWRMASKHFDDVVALDAGVFASVALQKFEMLLVDMDDQKAAYDYARNNLLGQLFASDAGALQMLADKIATDSKIDQPKRDMDLALEAAEAARRIAGENDPNALAVVAMVRFNRGEMDQAINLQRQAYIIASPKTKPEYKRVLNTYQAAADRNASLTRNPG